MHFNYLRSAFTHLAILGLVIGNSSDSIETHFFSKSNDFVVENNPLPKPNELFMDFDGDGILDDDDQDDEKPCS